MLRRALSAVLHVVWNVNIAHCICCNRLPVVSPSLVTPTSGAGGPVLPTTSLVSAAILFLRAGGLLPSEEQTVGVVVGSPHNVCTYVSTHQVSIPCSPSLSESSVPLPPREATFIVVVGVVSDNFFSMFFLSLPALPHTRTSTVAIPMLRYRMLLRGWKLSSADFDGWLPPCSSH